VREREVGFHPPQQCARCPRRCQPVCTVIKVARPMTSQSSQPAGGRAGAPDARRALDTHGTIGGQRRAHCEAPTRRPSPPWPWETPPVRRPCRSRGIERRSVRLVSRDIPFQAVMNASSPRAGTPRRVLLATGLATCAKTFSPAPPRARMPRVSQPRQCNVPCERLKEAPPARVSDSRDPGLTSNPPRRKGPAPSPPKIHMTCDGSFQPFRFEPFPVASTASFERVTAAQTGRQAKKQA